MVKSTEKGKSTKNTKSADKSTVKSKMIKKDELKKRIKTLETYTELLEADFKNRQEKENQLIDLINKLNSELIKRNNDIKLLENFLDIANSENERLEGENHQIASILYSRENTPVSPEIIESLSPDYE